MKEINKIGSIEAAKNFLENNNPIYKAVADNMDFDEETASALKKMMSIPFKALAMSMSFMPPPPIHYEDD